MSLPRQLTNPVSQRGSPYTSAEDSKEPACQPFLVSSSKNALKDKRKGNEGQDNILPLLGQEKVLPFANEVLKGA